MNPTSSYDGLYEPVGQAIPTGPLAKSVSWFRTVEDRGHKLTIP